MANITHHDINTALITDLLDNYELNVISMAVAFGIDPRGCPEYEKCKGLFTDEDGTQMHRETRLAFDRIVAERLTPKQ